MKITSRALRVRALGVPIAAFAALLLAGLSASTASSDTLQAGTSPSQTDTVLVPRITKGALGTLMRVKRNSPTARRYLATQTPRLGLPATKNEAGNADQKMACRAVALHNNQGAYSVAGGQKLVHCGSIQVTKTTFCAASMPCAQGAPCPMAMTCAI